MVINDRRVISYSLELQYFNYRTRHENGFSPTDRDQNLTKMKKAETDPEGFIKSIYDK